MKTEIIVGWDRKLRHGALDKGFAAAKIVNNARRKVSDKAAADRLIGNLLISIEERNYRTYFIFNCCFCGRETTVRADSKRISQYARCESRQCHYEENTRCGK